MELVESVGFGTFCKSLVEVHFDKSFGVWILSQVDTRFCCISMGRGASLKIQSSDVETVIGIPDSGVGVLGSGLDKSATCKAAIRNLVGCTSDEEDAYFACERLLRRAHGLADAQFITAFMIYVMGVLCGSKTMEMFEVDCYKRWRINDDK
jgi:hypothetical protein